MFFRTIKAVDSGLAAGKYDVTFAEKDQISTWALDTVGFVANREIMSGVGNNNMAPKGNVTREQGIAMVKRAYEKYK